MKDASRPLLDHLEELRRRLLILLGAFVLFFIGSLFFVDNIIHWLARMAGGFIFTWPAEAFFVRLKIAFFIALFISVPMMIYQVWRFVGEGLTPAERRWTFAIIPVSFVLFVVGLCFAWFIILPTALRFLLSFATEGLTPFLSIDQFLDFTGWISLAFGLMFQLPLVVVVLMRLGIVSAQTLTSRRAYIIVGLAVLAGVLTPGPDVFSQVALLVPSYLLFELSIVVGRFFAKRDAKSNS